MVARYPAKLANDIRSLGAENSMTALSSVLMGRSVRLAPSGPFVYRMSSPLSTRRTRPSTSVAEKMYARASSARTRSSLIAAVIRPRLSAMGLNDPTIMVSEERSSAEKTTV